MKTASTESDILRLDLVSDDEQLKFNQTLTRMLSIPPTPKIGKGSRMTADKKPGRLAPDSES